MRKKKFTKITNKGRKKWSIRLSSNTFAFEDASFRKEKVH
jgi:hypothetical protein